MNATALSQDQQRIYRVDKFKVPNDARKEFLEKVNSTHEVLRTVPGFLEDLILEQASGPGTFNFVTMVAWENATAIEVAKNAVVAKHAAMGFDSREMIARLGIESDIANYTQIGS